MLVTGIPREDHFHSDELTENAVRSRSGHLCKLNIDKKVYAQVCSIVNPASQDAIVVVAGPERRAMHAMKKIVERAKMALDGVPQETRRLLPDGNSEFLRVIHGKERIYPDTDTPPIVITQDLIQECRTKVGKRPWEISEELHMKYGLNQRQVDLLIGSENVERFHNYTKLGLEGSVAYRLLVELPRQKRREGLDVTTQTIDKLAQSLSRKLVTLAQADQLVDAFVQQPDFTVSEALKKMRVHRPSEAEVNKLVQKKLEAFNRIRLRSDEAYRKRIIPKIVGEVLIAMSHSIEGKTIAEKINCLLEQEDG
jgi:glutamyl-tRNA(Gln) amidotransferase subunit E